MHGQYKADNPVMKAAEHHDRAQELPEEREATQPASICSINPCLPEISEPSRKLHSSVLTVVVTQDCKTCHFQLEPCSGADNCKNRSNYDTSNRFGTNTLWGSLFKKKTRATQNFNMAAIFQDGRHGVLWNVIFGFKNGIKWWKKTILTKECVFWAIILHT